MEYPHRLNQRADAARLAAELPKWIDGRRLHCHRVYRRHPHGVFAVAQANSGSTFNEGTYTAQGLTVTAAGKQLSSAGDKPLHKLSDEIEKEKPEKGIRPPLKRRAARR